MRKDDRRFRDPAWEQNQLFDFIKQSYLLSSRWLVSTVAKAEGLDDKTAQKVDFYTRQFVDALAPTNFLLTNPEALRATVESWWKEQQQWNGAIATLLTATCSVSALKINSSRIRSASALTCKRRVIRGPP